MKEKEERDGHEENGYFVPLNFIAPLTFCGECGPEVNERWRSPTVARYMYFLTVGIKCRAGTKACVWVRYRWYYEAVK